MFTTGRKQFSLHNFWCFLSPPADGVNCKLWSPRSWQTARPIRVQLSSEEELHLLLLEFPVSPRESIPEVSLCFLCGIFFFALLKIVCQCKSVWILYSVGFFFRLVLFFFSLSGQMSDRNVRIMINQWPLDYAVPADL